MNILVIADVESKSLWDFYDKSKTEGIDLIISCGDLASEYLEFLVTMVGCPLLYVRGNHDRGYDSKPPRGCIDIDDMVYDYKGLRILGLGGSMRYKPGSDMYTEEEMAARVRSLRGKIAMTNGYDILVTHAPAAGYGDLPDLPHVGFQCFNDMMYQYRPKYMLHGHVHKDYGHFVREHEHPAGTRIINCYEKYVLPVGDDEHPAHGKTGSALYDLYVSINKRTRKSYMD